MYTHLHATILISATAWYAPCIYYITYNIYRVHAHLFLDDSQRTFTNNQRNNPRTIAQRGVPIDGGRPRRVNCILKYYLLLFPTTAARARSRCVLVLSITLHFISSWLLVSSRHIEPRVRIAVMRASTETRSYNIHGRVDGRVLRVLYNGAVI